MVIEPKAARLKGCGALKEANCAYALLAVASTPVCWRHDSPRRFSRSVSRPQLDVSEPDRLRGSPPHVCRHVGLQGEPAARQERLDDVGFLRGRLCGAAPARPERNDARRRDERVEPMHVPDEDQEPGLPDDVQHGLPGHHGAGIRVRVLLARRRARHPRARLGRHRASARRRRNDILRFQHVPDRHRRVARDAAVVHRASGTRTSCGARRAISSAPVRRPSRRRPS